MLRLQPPNIFFVDHTLVRGQDLARGGVEVDVHIHGVEAAVEATAEVAPSLPDEETTQNPEVPARVPEGVKLPLMIRFSLSNLAYLQMALILQQQGYTGLLRTHFCGLNPQRLIFQSGYFFPNYPV